MHDFYHENKKSKIDFLDVLATVILGVIFSVAILATMYLLYVGLRLNPIPVLLLTIFPFTGIWAVNRIM